MYTTILVFSDCSFLLISKEYCHVYADGSQAQVLQDLIDQSVSSKLPSFYITALSTLSGLNRESCNAACGEIRNEMCIMLLQLGKVFLSSIKGICLCTSSVTIDVHIIGIA